MASSLLASRSSLSLRHFVRSNQSLTRAQSRPHALGSWKPSRSPVGFSSARTSPKPSVAFPCVRPRGSTPSPSSSSSSFSSFGQTSSSFKSHESLGPVRFRTLSPFSSPFPSRGFFSSFFQRFRKEQKAPLLAPMNLNGRKEDGLQSPSAEEEEEPKGFPQSFIASRCASLRCEAPSLAPQDAQVLAFGRRWHLEHFRCVRCDVHLDPDHGDMPVELPARLSDIAEFWEIQPLMPGTLNSQTELLCIQCHLLESQARCEVCDVQLHDPELLQDIEAGRYDSEKDESMERARWQAIVEGSVHDELHFFCPEHASWFTKDSPVPEIHECLCCGRTDIMKAARPGLDLRDGCFVCQVCRDKPPVRMAWELETLLLQADYWLNAKGIAGPQRIVPVPEDVDDLTAAQLDQLMTWKKAVERFCAQLPMASPLAPSYAAAPALSNLPVVLLDGREMAAVTEAMAKAGQTLDSENPGFVPGRRQYTAMVVFDAVMLREDAQTRKESQESGKGEEKEEKMGKNRKNRKFAKNSKKNGNDGKKEITDNVPEDQPLRPGIMFLGSHFTPLQTLRRLVHEGTHLQVALRKRDLDPRVLEQVEGIAELASYVWLSEQIWNAETQFVDLEAVREMRRWEYKLASAAPAFEQKYLGKLPRELSPEEMDAVYSEGLLWARDALLDRGWWSFWEYVMTQGRLPETASRHS